MKNNLYILLYLLLSLLVTGCVMKDGKVQKVSFSGGRTIKTIEDVEKQRDLLQEGKRAPITALINAYNNDNLSHNIRMASLEALAESKDPLVLEAIQKSVRNTELFELDIEKNLNIPRKII